MPKAMISEVESFIGQKTAPVGELMTPHQQSIFRRSNSLCLYESDSLEPPERAQPFALDLLRPLPFPMLISTLFAYPTSLVFLVPQGRAPRRYGSSEVTRAGLIRAWASARAKSA